MGLMPQALLSCTNAGVQRDTGMAVVVVVVDEVDVTECACFFAGGEAVAGRMCTTKAGSGL